MLKKIALFLRKLANLIDPPTRDLTPIILPLMEKYRHSSQSGERKAHLVLGMAKKDLPDLSNSSIRLEIEQLYQERFK